MQSSPVEYVGNGSAAYFSWTASINLNTVAPTGAIITSSSIDASGLGGSTAWDSQWGDPQSGTCTYYNSGTDNSSQAWVTALTFWPGSSTAGCILNVSGQSSLSGTVTWWLPSVSAPNAPSGPSSGKPGASYTYSTGGSTATSGDTPQYMFNWGDGANSGWLASGTTSASHTWASAGTYQVTAVAEDASYGATSSSGSTTVTIAPTQYYLTTSAGSGGSISPASGWYNAGTVQVSATPAGGYYFTGFGGTLSGTTTPQSLTLSGATTVTASFAAVPATSFSTFPVGLSLTIDGSVVTCNAYCQYYWLPGSSHTIAASTQPGSTGTQWLFANWSDGGAASHGITASASGASYTATFNPQYYFTSSVSPAGAGTVAPGSGWYNAGAPFWVTATPYTGYQFSSFSPSGYTSSFEVVMNGPVSATANFVPFSGQAITSNPPGASFTVDGAACTAPCTFSWTAGTRHTIATASPQSPSTGTQLLFSGWSDGGAISHTVIAAAGVTYTATFTTQYLLTTIANPAAAGTISPATGWYNSGQVVQVSATPNAGAPCSGFSGGLTGTASPQNVTMTGPVSVTANFTTSFTLSPANQNANLAIPANSTPVAATYSFSAGNPNDIFGCYVDDPSWDLSPYVTATIKQRNASSVSVQYSAAPGAAGSGQATQFFPICYCLYFICEPVYFPPVDAEPAPIVFITAPQGVPKGGSNTFTVNYNGLGDTIFLSLSTAAGGTGSATFANGTTSMRLTFTGGASQQEQSVTVQGVQASTSADDVTISASYYLGELDSEQFSVVWVTISLQASNPPVESRTSSQWVAFTENVGGPSPGLGAEYYYANGSTVALNCGVGVELIGNVTPSNYPGPVYLQRVIVGTAVFAGNRPDPNVDLPPLGPEFGPGSFVNTAVGSGYPGNVFSLDLPSIGPGQFAITPERYRTNFSMYAVLGTNQDENPPQASASFPYWVAVSCGGTPTTGPAFNYTYAGDNAASAAPPGAIPLTYNLLPPGN